MKGCVPRTSARLAESMGQQRAGKPFEGSPAEHPQVDEMYKRVITKYSNLADMVAPELKTH